MLPKFRLFRQQMYGPDIEFPITPETRVLLYVARDKAKKEWKITQNGFAFFWGTSPPQSETLRRMAREALAIRTRWNKTLALRDVKPKVEALWLFVIEQDQRFSGRAIAELQKVGPVAGDYIMAHWPKMDAVMRMMFV